MEPPAVTPRTPRDACPRRPLVVSALALSALSLLPLTASAQQNNLPDEARIVWTRGTVDVLGPTAHAAQPGETLTRGTRLRTGADGAVAVTFANGAVGELDANGLLVMFAPAAPLPADAPPSNSTTLARGTLRIRAATTGARTVPVPVETQAVTVWAGRADAMLSADLGGHITRMAVWRGRMRVRMGRREYLLTQGYGVQEEVGHAPGVLQQLPRAPVWRATPPARVLSFGEPIEVSGAWAPSPHSGTAAPREWKVQVARDDGFRDLVESVRVPAATTRWTGRALPPGTYHVRIVTVDVNRFESTASPVARVQVAAPTVVPALDGPDERRASVRIPQGFFCGLDGAPLASSDASLLLAPGRAHTLRCATDPAGRNARERVIPAGLSGPLRREIDVGAVAADREDGAASGALSLRLRDAAGEPVSLARVDAVATGGVTVDAVRETEQRGVYTATLHWPAGVRACRVRFTLNESLEFEHEARAPRVQVVAAAAPTPRREPPRVQVDVVQMAPPRDPEDDAPLDREE